MRSQLDVDTGSSSCEHGELTWDPEACFDALTQVRITELAPQIETPGACVYLLVDPILGDPVMAETPQAGLAQDVLNAQRSEAWRRSTYALTVPKGLSLDGAHAPYLVELLGAQDPWVDTSVQWAVQETMQTWKAEPERSTPHRVGGWLQSAALGPQLAEALSDMLCLRTQAHTRARYLRLADRRVLSLAVHVLGDAAMASSLAPVQRWHWLDPHAAWRSLTAIQANTPDASGQAVSQPRHARKPLVFTQAQWEQMAVGEAVHAVVASAIQQSLSRHEAGHPTQWAPVSASQWQAALNQALPKHP